MSIDIFSPKRPPVLGIDISSSAVRVVDVALVKGKIRLEGFAVQSLTDGVLVDGKVVDQSALNDAIGAALKSLRTRVRHAVLGLPPTVFVSKRVTLSAALHGEDMDFAIRNECAKFVAFPMSDVNVDYQVLGPARGEVDMNDVLVGAVQTNKVDELVAMVDAAGVKPYIVDGNALAAQTVISLIAPPGEYRDSNVVYVHIGSQSTMITVFRNGIQIHTKDQSFGADQLTADLMQRIGCSRDDALAIQRGDIDEPAEYAEVLAEFAETAGQEVARGYRLFANSGYEADAAKFVIGGRVASLQAVIDAIQAHTGVSTQIADPFERIDIGADVDLDLLAIEAPSLITAFGLALRKFDEKPSLLALLEGSGLRKGADDEQSRPKLNLLPYREAQAKENRRQLGVLTGGMAVLALGVGVLVHGVFASYIAHQEQRNAFIESQTLILDEQIGEINRLKGEIAALMARRKVIEELQADRAQTVQIMDQLVKLVPAGLHLKSVKQEGNVINVSGYAISSDMVSAFMASVAASKVLDKPELVEIRATEVNKRRLNEFSMHFKVRRSSSEETKPENDKPAAGGSQPSMSKG